MLKVLAKEDVDTLIARNQDFCPPQSHGAQDPVRPLGLSTSAASFVTAMHGLALAPVLSGVLYSNGAEYTQPLFLEGPAVEKWETKAATYEEGIVSCQSSDALTQIVRSTPR